MLPRAFPPRTPGLPSDGRFYAALAPLLGRRRNPWALAAADALGEQQDGRYTVRVGIVLVPRQSGKTTFALDLALARMLAYPDYRVAYTAQTGHVTTERFGERFAEVARIPGLGRRLQLRRSQGTERITAPGGSYLKAFPPLDGALRGSALDLVILDEAQEHGEQLGAALDHTIGPVFTTRRDRGGQLLLIATAGTDRSAYLRKHLDLARDGAPGYALIDYGMPDGADPADPATWQACHPGLAAGLTDAEFLATAQAQDPAAFLREHMNVWTTTAAGHVIAPEVWAACQAPDLARPSSGMVLGVDASRDRSRAAVGAAWLDNGALRLGVRWHGDATRLRDAAQAQAQATGARVYHDAYSSGPASAGTDWQAITATRLAAASAMVLEQARDGSLKVRPDRDGMLTAAVLAARLRPIGQHAGQTFDRKDPAADITPLMACVIAAAGLLGQGPGPVLV